MGWVKMGWVKMGWVKMARADLRRQLDMRAELHNILHTLWSDMATIETNPGRLSPG
jgi:hypothetical protein